MKNKLQAKDLINVGIFTALYFVIFFATGCLGYIPILMVLIPLICPIVAGIPMMLYVTKVKKFGMITITGIICGLLMLFSGNNYYPAITAPIFGLVFDLILKAGNYKNTKGAILGYGVFSIWLMGMMMPFYISAESYMASLAVNYGTEYITSLTRVIPPWTFPLYAAFAFIGGILGALLGKSVLNKHFKKAGLA